MTEKSSHRRKKCKLKLTNSCYYLTGR